LEKLHRPKSRLCKAAPGGRQALYEPFFEKKAIPRPTAPFVWIPVGLPRHAGAGNVGKLHHQNTSEKTVNNDTNQALKNRAQAVFTDSAAVKTQIAASDAPDILARMAQTAGHSIQNGGKVMLCGNGGSAADAQHIAAELVVRLRAERERDALPALTLTQDTSTLTACANDYGFDHIFERPLRALGRTGDVLIGITTSGGSPNVVKAMEAAKDMGITVFGFLGGSGGKALAICDEAFVVPDSDTGRIQESHITAGHVLVELIEDVLKAET